MTLQHTQVHMLECTHTHTHGLTLRRVTTLSYKQDCVTMSWGVDILWSERIGYSGSDLESDFGWGEGRHV